VQDVAVERLHHVFVSAGFDRLGNALDVVFGGAEHHDRRVAARLLAQLLQEIDAAHHRHRPIE
jgi:hypothetical protein